MKIWNVKVRGKKVYQVVVDYQDPGDDYPKKKKFIHLNI